MSSNHLVGPNHVGMGNGNSLGEPPEGGVGLLVQIAADRTTFRAVELDKYSVTAFSFCGT